MIKFTMGQETLGTLAKQTSGSQDELTTLLHQLVQACEPIRQTDKGAARAAIETFAGQVDVIAADLNNALGRLHTMNSSVDTTYQQAQQDMADEARSAMSSVNFDAARFAPRA